MGSDIQSPVLSTNAISLIDGIKGQIPPEIKNEKTNTDPLLALRTSELQYIPCNDVLSTELSARDWSAAWNKLLAF